MSITITINGEDKTSRIRAEGDIAITKAYGEPWTCDLQSFSLAGETQEIEADGVDQQWVLDRIPANIPTVTVDGTPATVGLYGVDTGKDFYWELGTRNLYQDPGDPPLALGVVIAVDLGTWYPSSGQTILIEQTHEVSFEILGDGSTTVFQLPQIPSEILNIVRDDLHQQTFGEYGVDTGKQWYIDYETGELHQEAGDPPLDVDEPLNIAYDYIITVFAGIIRRVNRRKNYSNSPALFCDLNCTDFNHILERRLSGVFELAPTTDNAVLARLMTDVLTAEGITTDLSTAVAIDNFRAKNDTCAGAVSALTTLTEKKAWIDTAKVLHMQTPADSAAPFDIPSGASNIATLEVAESDAEYCNRVIVEATQAITEERQQDFTGDGSATSFELDFPAASVRQVLINGVPNDIGVIGGPDDKDWYWQSGSREIRQDADGVVLTGADTLTVFYSPIESLYVTAEDAGEIAARAAKEGSTGIYEKLFQVDRLNSLADVQAIADGILAARSTIPLEATYTTNDRLEPEAKNLQPGQKQAILLDGWASQQNDYIVRSIRLTTMGTPATKDWIFRYTVQASYGAIAKSVFQFFRQSGGSSTSGGVGGGHELKNFFLGGCDVVPVGNNISPHRPILYAPGSVAMVMSYCKTAPASDLTFDIVRSVDDGATFSDITASPMVHPSGEIGVVYFTSFAAAASDLPRGTLFDVNVTANGSAEGWSLVIAVL